MEEERKWEDLNRDLLVEIFGRVGIESLSQCIPFVCNSWYKATLVPKCWETLVFPYAYVAYDYHGTRLCSDEFVKSAVDRSQGTATHIKFDYCCPNGLVYISEKCSELKSLYLCIFDDFALICDLICKWKKLEFLRLYDHTVKNLKPTLESISLHCKNFVELSYRTRYMCEADSAAIVEFIPKIKSLNMNGMRFPRDCLILILKGCRELEFLDVSRCKGFDAHDTEILELASHIRSFNCDGSLVDDSSEDVDDDDDDYDYYYPFYDDDYPLDHDHFPW